MAPAFSSTKQAASFTLLLLVLLLLPVLVGKRWLPPREECYSALTWRYCATEWVHQQIFEEKSDIDIAFVGSSRMWAGIDTAYVQKELSKKLGREAVVRTIAWAWLGCDANYFITKDLLEHRKVKMMVFDDEYRGDNAPHAAAAHWFRYGDDASAIAGMPLRVQMSYYFAAILGMPRNLLSLVRRNDPAVLPKYDDFHWADFYHSPNSKDHLGALIGHHWDVAGQPFSDYTPSMEPPSSAVVTYSAATKDRFRFSAEPITPWQVELVREFAGLAADHGTKLVFVHLTPSTSDDEVHSPVIQERVNWAEALDHSVTMIGVPPAQLYAGMKNDDIEKLFISPDHFHYNKNGQEFFTRVITPTLLELYGYPATH
jgi:hypothetical protein